MSDDIGHILTAWKYDPGEDLIVRVIHGDDGRPKLQMRVDMGIIQMEMDGHPAGEHPQGEDSWLEYYERLEREYEASEVDDYFSLDDEDAQHLQQEGVQYYYRYLSLMQLEDYPRVVRDTERNLRLFAFAKKYAVNEVDRWALDQYRPYVIMMNARARAALVLRSDPAGGIDRAVEYLDTGIGKIIAFYNEYNLAPEIENSVELSILKSLKREFLRLRPREVPLEEQLEQAIREEQFEEAARIRDLIRERDRERKAPKH